MSESLSNARMHEKDLVTKAVGSALGTNGIARIPELIDEYDIQQMHHEAERVPYTLRRAVPEWHNTTRATFVPLGADVCAAAGIPQPERSVESRAGRVSVTAANLVT